MKIGGIHWKKFEKFLFEIGCVFVSEVGDHRKYYKEGVLRPIIVPRQKNLAPFIIQNNLRTLGISRDCYLSIINKI